MTDELANDPTVFGSCKQMPSNLEIIDLSSRLTYIHKAERPYRYRNAMKTIVRVISERADNCKGQSNNVESPPLLRRQRTLLCFADFLKLRLPALE